MNEINRLEFLKTTGLALAASGLPPLRAQNPRSPSESAAFDWIRNTRIVIAEGYNPPFYPSFDYVPGKAVQIVRDLNADAIRYPSASYYAFFPTKSGYPVHPELRGDPMGETIELCRKSALKTVAYVPLNHPFMDARSGDPRYSDWSKKFADGRAMTTEHYGYGTYFEGCLNSPVRDVIQALVREVLTQYPVDVMFFDGPYQGMANAKNYCHCPHCEAAYRKRFGRPVPNQDQPIGREEQIRYTQWMANEVVIAFLDDIRRMIRRTRDVPVLFNDTSLLSRREWRNRAIPVADGFMFEAAETPEDKLFNLQLGRSTGKVTWTYVGSHTQYNREHLKDDRVRGWFSFPVESEELLLDGATAVAGGAGLLYWGVARFYYQAKGALAYDSGRYVREIFDLQASNDALLRSVAARPRAGILVGDQTVDWYEGRHFVGKAFENGLHGAYKLLKAHSIDAEPFLDWQMSPEVLARYPILWAANAVCLSTEQCRMIETYVHSGGLLLATHLTSAADEFGRVRRDFGLAGLFGASFEDAEPVEIPDLYLRPVSGEELPQDPQVVRIRAEAAEVLAETIDRGRRKNLGPAVVRRKAGKGAVIYIASQLDAVYEETSMEAIREYFGSILREWIAPRRTYEVAFRPGLLPHLVASNTTLLLHLLSDTGTKNKHLRSREWYSPITEVQVRIRIPAGRSVASVRLLRAGHELPATTREGWIEATVPQVFVHEAVRVDLT